MRGPTSLPQVFRRSGLLVLAFACLLAACLLALAAPSFAAASPTAPASLGAVPGKLHLRKPALGAPGSTTKPRWACPEGACDAIVVPQSTKPIKVALGSGERRGLDPQDLQSVYHIPSTLARGPDGRDRRRLRLSKRRIGPRQVSRTVWFAGLHQSERLLQKGQRERRRSQLPRRRTGMGRRGGAGRGHGLGGVPAVPHPAGRGHDRRTGRSRRLGQQGRQTGRERGQQQLRLSAGLRTVVRHDRLHAVQQRLRPLGRA